MSGLYCDCAGREWRGGKETGEPLRARRGQTGSCRATGRASTRLGIGGSLLPIKGATKDEYRYKLIKIYGPKLKYRYRYRHNLDIFESQLGLLVVLSFRTWKCTVIGRVSMIYTRDIK